MKTCLVTALTPLLLLFNIGLGVEVEGEISGEDGTRRGIQH